MNKFYMNGKLIHKASDHNTKRCEVEKWVFLPHSDFERLKANPYQEHEAITAARDLMYEDKNAYHCIMLLDEYGEDGLLIEAEGFDYPRLSMFVPDAKSIYERYQTSEPELKLHDMIKDTVEKIAELAHTGKIDFTSADMIDMDEVESLVKDAIVQQLAQRDDIKMAKNTDIGVDFQPDIHVEAEKLTELKFYCPLMGKAGTQIFLRPTPNSGNVIASELRFNKADMSRFDNMQRGDIIVKGNLFSKEYGRNVPVILSGHVDDFPKIPKNYYGNVL